MKFINNKNVKNISEDETNIKVSPEMFRSMQILEKLRYMNERN